MRCFLLVNGHFTSITKDGLFDFFLAQFFCFVWKERKQLQTKDWCERQEKEGRVEMKWDTRYLVSAVC